MRCALGRLAIRRARARPVGAVRRGGPLVRKTPLAQGDKGLARGTPLARDEKGLARTPLARTTPIARTSNKPPAARKPAKPAKPGVTTETRTIVLARCGGRCEACGKPLGQSGVDMHHRQGRRWRNHSPANLVALHDTCHTVAPEAVHQRPAWARERGLIVRSTEDPAATPLTLPSGRRVLLGESYEDAPPIAA